MSAATIQPGRDPFARWTIRKRKVYSTTTCAWCGGTHTNAKGTYLWQYYVDADSPRESGPIGPRVCDIGCLRAYLS